MFQSSAARVPRLAAPSHFITLIIILASSQTSYICWYGTRYPTYTGGALSCGELLWLHLVLTSHPLSSCLTHEPPHVCNNQYSCGASPLPRPTYRQAQWAMFYESQSMLTGRKRKTMPTRSSRRRTSPPSPRPSSLTSSRWPPSRVLQKCPLPCGTLCGPRAYRCSRPFCTGLSSKRTPWRTFR